MIQSLVLHNFKNFREATLRLGSFSVLVGTNASGKSNVRDAVRVLHAIGRGYRLGEVFGEKRGESGEQQWTGIRGGTREAAFHGDHQFGIEVNLRLVLPRGEKPKPVTYQIYIDTGEREEAASRDPRVIKEQLEVEGYNHPILDSHPEGEAIGSDRDHIQIKVRKPTRGRHPKIQFLNSRPALTQMVGHDDENVVPSQASIADRVARTLARMRFLDLSPKAMREPSVPGQTVLGDRGENLSSVLKAICEDEKLKGQLTEWVQELTPMDAVDFKFPTDFQGRTLVTLVEKGGEETSAYSASDGTLRFLAVIAALLGPEHADLYFIEELENGIHPTRIDLLLQLIEQSVAAEDIQVMATTHSPQLLRLLNEETLGAASVVYRHEGRPEAQITRVKDIPYVDEVLERKDLGRLFESGWLEDSLSAAQAASDEQLQNA
jgi:predicted ATPase